MFRRGENVPYAFVAEAEEFRSNVTPPARKRATPGQVAGRTLTGLVLVAGLVGSVLLGMPALDAEQQRERTQQQEQAGHER